MKENSIEVVEIKNEINRQFSDKETLAALMATSFKGLEAATMKRAVLEGMLRGFTFKDFLEKNVYAIPFKEGYSLVTSIDYARKIGMRSGIVGKDAPVYEMEGDKILSCTVTVKRKIDGYVGDYSATVFFKEYNTARQQWATKPRTMIAKVAEMHALRMACPEELSQAYSEEEKQLEVEEPTIDITPHKEKLESVKTLDELKKVWSNLPPQAKEELKTLKDELRKKYENIEIQ
jgi:hypothetical protein